MTYTEVKTKTCTVRIYASGSVAYKRAHGHRWVHLIAGGHIGRRRRRAKASPALDRLRGQTLKAVR